MRGNCYCSLPAKTRGKTAPISRSKTSQPRWFAAFWIILNARTRQRRLTPATTNRLAAIHSFFNYHAATDPRHLAQCQSILAVPFKRGAARVPEYLEREEVQKIFSEIKNQTPLGQRDDALLRLLYNTGMRAQELVSLNVNHLRFESRPYYVRIHGKGNKERTCPLWTETVQAIKSYLEPRSALSG